MKKTILLVTILLSSMCSFAQLVINTTQNPTQIIQNNFLGTNVTISNVKFNNVLNVSISRDQFSDFTTGNIPTNLGLSSGIILSTGRTQVALGPNNASGQSSISLFTSNADPDLALLSGNLIASTAAVEFDFVATQSEINFDYIFASEEYPEYSVSSFNDVFGVFLSGLGISGSFSNNAKNIALLPTTNTSSSVVSIANVNNGSANSGPCKNCQYYINNGQGPNSTIQYDGFTTLLNASSIITVGETYHLKIAIANVADNLFDSAIFLKANSFSARNLSNTTFENSKFTLSPNPAKDFLTITNSDSNDLIENITIKNVIGKTVYSSEKNNSNHQNIDISNLSKGVYFVEIKTKNNFKQTKKLLVE